MNVNLITSDELDLLMKKLEALDKKVELLTSGISTKPLYTIKETCELLQVSKRTLQRYRDTGLLSFTQVNDKIMFQRADIEAFLNGNRVEAFSKKGGQYAIR